MLRKLFGATAMVLLAAGAGLPLSGLAHADETGQETTSAAEVQAAPEAPAEEPAEELAAEAPAKAPQAEEAAEKAAEEFAEKATVKAAKPAKVKPQQAEKQHPGVAEADEVVDGTCSATLLGGRGRPLLVDADALVGDGLLPAVRLGSSSDRIAEERAVNLPVGDVVERLGVGNVPVVGQVAEAGCAAVDTAGDAVNAVAATTSALTSSVETVGGTPEAPVDPVEPVDPEQPEEDLPAGGVVTDVLPSLPQGGLQNSPLTSTPLLAALPLGPLPEIDAPLPDAARQQTAGMRIEGRADELSTTNTGQARALPRPSVAEPAKAPFVLAVGLLSVVAALLARRWITRSAG